VARKSVRVPITASGRDAGKVFVLHEMPADQAEWWFYRFVMALANAGAKIPEEVLFAGAAGFAEMLPTLRNSLVVGMRALQGLTAPDVEPLLKEMLPCIKFQPPGSSPAPPEQEIFPGINSQIEEVATWLKLRFELIQLHVGFSLADAALTTGEPPPPPVSPA
jgi:hypothetical protein